MSDALPLPPRPNLEQYKKLAKDFLRAGNAGESDDVRGWLARWLQTLSRLQGQEITTQAQAAIERLAARMEQRWRQLTAKKAPGECVLADAQLFIAREHGFTSWPKFAEHLVANGHRASTS